MKSKEHGLFIILLLLIPLIIPLINAQSREFQIASESIKKVLDSSIGLLTPFFEFVIGDYSTTEFFFAKVLMLILLFMIINVILKKTPFGEKGQISLLISAVISILAIRFISENELFNGILLPYGTLGVAITTLIPFIIFFYFLHETNIGPIGRRIGWIFFIIIFLALWALKYSDLSSTSNLIYFWTLVATIIILIFDKQLHKYLGIIQTERYLTNVEIRRIANLQAEYEYLLHTESQQAQRRREQIVRQLREMGAGIN